MFCFLMLYQNLQFGILNPIYSKKISTNNQIIILIFFHRDNFIKLLTSYGTYFMLELKFILIIKFEQWDHLNGLLISRNRTW